MIFRYVSSVIFNKDSLDLVKYYSANSMPLSKVFEVVEQRLIALALKLKRYIREVKFVLQGTVEGLLSILVQ